jgi:hypothetical protein
MNTTNAHAIVTAAILIGGAFSVWLLVCWIQFLRILTKAARRYLASGPQGSEPAPAPARSLPVRPGLTP